MIAAFLDHLEHDRGNSPRTRNARLAAIHSVFGYAALHHPEHAETIARVLAIPPKRFDKALVTWLTEPELAALLSTPDLSTWAGRRDHALILLAAQTGLRISELTGLTTGDIHLSAGAHVSCTGKGRKQRITPLTAKTVTVLRTWITERGGQSGQPLFPNRTGGRLSRDAVEHRLAKHTREVPRAFRTVRPLGWAIWKGEFLAPTEEELLTGVQGRSREDGDRDVASDRQSGEGARDQRRYPR